MANRNISCPLDSSKNYKKCDDEEQTADLQEVLKKEIAIIHRRFIDTMIPQFHTEDMMERVGIWFPPLIEFFPHQLIDALFFDTYVYVENEKLWKTFVQQELSKPQLPQIKAMLEAWLNPFWLLAKVIDQDAKSASIKNELNEKVYELGITAELKVGDWLFGIAFRDPNAAENRLYESKSLIVIPQQNNGLVEELRAKLKNFDGNSLDLYLSIKKAELGSED